MLRRLFQGGVLSSIKNTVRDISWNTKWLQIQKYLVFALNHTTKYAGLGLRQPLLISVKTLPYKTSEIKQNKRKTNTRNIKSYSTQSQWTNKQNKKIQRAVLKQTLK